MAIGVAAVVVLTSLGDGARRYVTGEFEGTATDILTPNGRSTRMMTTTNGDGSYTMKMFDTRKDSGEFQSMELHYTRG